MIIEPTPQRVAGRRKRAHLNEPAFIQAVESATIYDHPRQPVVEFNPDAAAIIREAARLRERGWGSTHRTNPLADMTGLCGEMAAYRYFGYCGEDILSMFLDGLNGGDDGTDLAILRNTGSPLLVDVKSTAGGALKFKFNARNAHSDRANAYLFTQVIYDPSGAVLCRLLGWSERHKLTRYKRFDGRMDTVRFDTLHREHVVNPVSILKEIKAHG